MRNQKDLLSLIHPKLLQTLVYKNQDNYILVPEVIFIIITDFLNRICVVWLMGSAWSTDIDIKNLSNNFNHMKGYNK